MLHPDVQVVVGRTGDQTLTNEAGEVTRSGCKQAV